MDYTIPPDHQVHLDQVYTLAPPKLWHLPAEIWEKIHARVTGKGVTACVLDTGMNSHPELPEPVKAKSFISGQSWRDGNGHGTHVAGTLLGSDVGVAPEAKLMVGKVLSDQGSGGSPGIAAGIRWAVDEGADVISMSLGGGSPDTPTNEAIDYAFSNGAVVNVADRTVEEDFDSFRNEGLPPGTLEALPPAVQEFVEIAFIAGGLVAAAKLSTRYSFQDVARNMKFVEGCKARLAELGVVLGDV